MNEQDTYNQVASSFTLSTCKEVMGGIRFVLFCYLIVCQQISSFSSLHRHPHHRQTQSLRATTTSSTLIPTAIKSRGNEQTDLDLAQWAYEQGVEYKKLCIGKEVSTGRRGLFATEQINIGETILKVPLTLCFQSKEVDGSNWPVEMALSLLEECNKGGESKYAPYIASLPKPTELVLPTMWPESALLNNAIFVEAVELVKAWQKTALEDPIMIEKIRENNAVDLDALTWALNIIQTRNCKCTAFSSWYLKSSGSNINLLAPIFDLLNHSDDAKTTFYQSDGFLCLDTTVGYAQNEEVFLNYGEHCPFALLAKYDFWPDESPKNILPIVIPRKLTVPLLLEEGEKRLELLQSMDVLVSGTFQLKRDGDIPNNLILALMVISATESEIDEIMMLMANHFELFECIFDAENEDEDQDECGKKACQSLLKLIAENLVFGNKLEQTSKKLLLDALEDMKNEDHQDDSNSIDMLKDANIASEVIEHVKKTRKGFKEYKLKLISDIVENILTDKT